MGAADQARRTKCGGPGAVDWVQRTGQESVARCQCPTQTRQAVTQSARRPLCCDKKYKKPHLVQAVRCETKCPGSVRRLDIFLWNDWLYLTLNSHVELGRVINPPFHMTHFPVRRHGWPIRNFYRSAGFKPRTEVRQVQAFNHLNTSD